MTARRAAQGALFGGRESIPAQRRAKQRPVTNDMDLIESVIKTAGEPGYVLIGPSERVYRRHPERPGEVERTPGYEADAVHQLLTGRLLTRGGGHAVRYGRYEGRATSVLVPRSTTSTAQRWNHYQPPASWTGK